MAQIHYDYDTDVIPKNFAEEGDPSSGSSIKTKQKGSRTRGGHIPPSKRQRAEEDDQLHENGKKEEKAQINANSRSTEQISRGLASERLAKLQALKQRMRASADANKQDVIAEHDHKTGTLKPWEEDILLRKRREAETLIATKEALEKGEDITRKQALGYTLEEVEDWEQRQLKKKANVYDAFKSIDHANARKYRKLQDGITPDQAKYQKQKQKHEGHTLAHGAAAGEDAALFEDPDPESLRSMVTDLHEQFKRRKQHSRRRAHDPNADVSYINEKNRHFSEKLSRAYDKYTEDIRAAFERGTAL